MIAPLMAYALVASILLAVAAMAAEWGMRSVGRPGRFAWMMALGSTLLLTALAPLRFPAEPAPALGLSATMAMAAPVEATSSRRWAPAALDGALAAIRSTIQRPIVRAAEVTGDTGGSRLAVAWLALSSALLIVGIGTLLRYRRMRRSWPTREVDGVRVRVSPRVGPAVLGILRPEIVLPEWLMASSAEERRLAILHEREHLRAHDSLTLGLGCGAAALMPWNPVVWWMLLRLRLAVEVDCDARVLRNGVPARAYGSMLIDVSGHGSGLSLGVPALAGFPSTLEKRLMAMTTRISRGSAVRGGFVALVALAAVLAACEARMPTAAEVADLDVAAVQAQAGQLGILGGDAESTTYIVNGEVVSAEEARVIAPDRIATVEVERRRGPEGEERGTIRIETREAAGAAGGVVERGAREIEIVRDSSTVLLAVRADSAGSGPLVAVRAVAGAGLRTGGVVRAGPDSVIRIERRAIQTLENGLGPAAISSSLSDNPALADPLVLIDGVVADEGALQRVRPDDIASISVLKNADQVDYPDPRARNGVVIVTTKEGRR